MIPTLFPNYWIFDVTLYAFMNECKTKTTMSVVIITDRKTCSKSKIKISQFYKIGQKRESRKK